MAGSSQLNFGEDSASAGFQGLRFEVMRKLAQHGRFAPAFLKAKMVIFMVVAGACYLGLILAQPSGWAALALGIGFGVGALMAALHGSHDAAHGCFSSCRRANTVALFVPFAVLGVDPAMWRTRHLRSHHRFPNVDRCDADIDENPFLRLSPHQPKRKWHRWQHYYAWPLYMCVALHATWVQDFHYMRRATLANMRDWRERCPSWPRFLGLKLLHLAAVYVAPIAVLPFSAWMVLAGVFAIQAGISLLFVLPLIGTHFSDRASFPRAENGRISASYISHQVLASVDWSPSSRFYCGLMGGLNAHTAHHLFPNVSHAHYWWISREIDRFCTEHGLPRHAGGLGSAIWGHARFLRKMALLPAPGQSR